MGRGCGLFTFLRVMLESIVVFAFTGAVFVYNLRGVVSFEL